MTKRISIVGSRRRTDRGTVESYVATLPGDAVIVSGGCRGVDTWAADAAQRRGLSVEIHRPNLQGVRCRGEAARRYHERDAVIASECDVLVALPAPDRKGGTEVTIRAAERLGRTVILL